MKHLFLIFAVCAIFTISACNNATQKPEEEISDTTEVSITFKNPTDFARNTETIVLSRNRITELTGEIPENKIPVFKDTSGAALLMQADDLDGDNHWDELFIVTDFKANEQKKTIVEFVSPTELPQTKARTNIRFARKPENENGTYTELTEDEYKESREDNRPSQNFQMEGPAWENEFIAFRNYYDDRNGADIFGKRVTEPVLDKVGINQDYHKLEDWGMDVLKVGNSLGAGAIALYIDNKLYKIGSKSPRKYKQIVDGPLRSILEFTFDSCVAAGEVYRVVHRISIATGTHCYKSEVTISDFNQDKDLVTGIVNKKSDSLIVTNHNSDYISLATHAKQSENDDLLGMGLLINKDVFIENGETPDEGEGITETYYARLKIQNDKPVSYRFYSVWELQDPKFQDSKEFIKLLQSDADRLANPIIVE